MWMRVGSHPVDVALLVQRRSLIPWPMLNPVIKFLGYVLKPLSLSAT
jgi:hypothetical protein